MIAAVHVNQQLSGVIFVPYQLDCQLDCSRSVCFYAPARQLGFWQHRSDGGFPRDFCLCQKYAAVRSINCPRIRMSLLHLARANFTSARKKSPGKTIQFITNEINGLDYMLFIYFQKCFFLVSFICLSAVFVLAMCPIFMLLVGRNINHYQFSI